jgi:hypothetical protein
MKRAVHLICSAILTAYARAFANRDTTDLDITLLETAKTNFVIKSSQYCHAEFEISLGISSIDKRWGGFRSLQISADEGKWIAVSESGVIFVAPVSLTMSDSPSVTVIELLDESTRKPLTVESLATISGSAMRDPGFDSALVRVSSESSPIRLFSKDDSGLDEGMVFEREFEDPLALCTDVLRQRTLSCSNMENSQVFTSVPEEDGQSTGSLLFLCKTRSESDGLFHGWACNPSTGDTWSYTIDLESDWTIADWKFCGSCSVPQILLLSNNEISFSVDSVLLSAIHDDGSKIQLADDMAHGRIRLFWSSSTSNVKALSVNDYPGEEDMLLVHVGGSPDKSGVTPVHIFNIKMTSEASATFEDIKGRGYRLISFIIVFLILVFGVGVPIIIIRYPLIKTKFEKYILGRDQNPKYISLTTKRSTLRPIDGSNLADTEGGTNIPVDSPNGFGRRGRSNPKSLEIVVE